MAVRWYLRYGLSYRDVEELLAERGIEVDHVTVFRWVVRFDPRPCSPTSVTLSNRPFSPGRGEFDGVLLGVASAR